MFSVSEYSTGVQSFLWYPADQWNLMQWILYVTHYYSYNIIILMHVLSLHESCTILGQKIKVQMYRELMFLMHFIYLDTYT